MEKFGVAPNKVVQVQALAGDSTDNVPGVRGIGIKTAAELINVYGDIEALLAKAERDKAAQAARDPDRECGECPRLPQAGDARRQGAIQGKARRVRGA